MQKKLSSALGTEVLLPNEPAIGVLDKTAFTLVRYYDNMEDLLKLDKAKEYKEFHKMSVMSKIMMLTGLLSMLFLR